MLHNHSISLNSEENPLKMIRIVLCTCPDEGTARSLAEGLMEERLAACVNIVPGIKSVYRWEGEIREDTEVMLLIKTTAEGFPRVRDYLVNAHPYELPEVIALPIEQGYQPYLDWVSTHGE